MSDSTMTIICRLLLLDCCILANPSNINFLSRERRSDFLNFLPLQVKEDLMSILLQISIKRPFLSFSATLALISLRMSFTNVLACFSNSSSAGRSFKAAVKGEFFVKDNFSLNQPRLNFAAKMTSIFFTKIDISFRLIWLKLKFCWFEIVENLSFQNSDILKNAIFK